MHGTASDGTDVTDSNPANAHVVDATPPTVLGEFGYFHQTVRGGTQNPERLPNTGAGSSTLGLGLVGLGLLTLGALTLAWRRRV